MPACTTARSMRSICRWKKERHSSTMNMSHLMTSLNRTDEVPVNVRPKKEDEQDETDGTDSDTEKCPYV